MTQFDITRLEHQLDKDLNYSVYFDRETGKTYMTQRQMAKMCGVREVSIRWYIKKYKLTPIKAKVSTTFGLRDSNLLCTSEIADLVAKIGKKSKPTNYQEENHV